MAIWNAQGELLYANRAWKSCFGGGSHEPWLSRLGEPLQTQVREALRRGEGVAPVRAVWQPSLACGRLDPSEGEFALSPWPAAEGVVPAGGTPAHERCWLARWLPLDAQHRAERRAEILAERLEVAQEFGRLGVWGRDLRSGGGFWDAHVFRFFGMPVREGAPSFQEANERVHPEDQERLRRLWYRSLEAEGRYDAHYRVVQPDGSLKRIHSQWMVKADASGRPARVVGVMMDDTDSYEIGRRMESISTHLAMAAELVGLVIWHQDWASGITHFNDEGARLLGLQHARPLHIVEIYAHLHPDDRPVARQASERALRENAPVDAMLRYLQPDGSARLVLTRRVAERDADGRCVAIIGVALDLTDRERTEAELREARHRIALAAQGVGMGTWERDLVHDVSYWDAQMYRLRGLRRDEPRPANELRIACVHPDDVEPMLRTYREAWQDRGCDVVGHEFRVVWPDGSVHWLASRARILRDASGRPVRMLGVNWDITEVKQAEQIRREKEAAEQSSRAKSEFLARMSHELRTPLNAVLGFAQVLQADQEEPLSGPQRTRVDHIVAAGRHLLALIDDVLDLARIESGAVQLEARVIALQDAVVDAVELVAPIARRADIAVHLGPLQGWVVADRLRLRQILMNLLSNAVKYNRPGGEVIVSGQSRPPWAWIEVRDTGIGMSEEQLKRLFEPFNRLGREREGIEGTGIGLAIAQQLAQHMGGIIKVRSRPGEGSEFRLWLPAGEDGQRSASWTSPAAHEVPSVRPRASHLLYVEDNPVNVLLVEELVRLRPGVQLSVATSGAEGVEMARRLQPDLALIDMQLPDITGEEVLRRLRADPSTAYLRCIALSANAMQEDVDRALAAGFEAYWTKPIDVKRFLHALDETLATE